MFFGGSLRGRIWNRLGLCIFSEQLIWAKERSAGRWPRHLRPGSDWAYLPERGDEGNRPARGQESKSEEQT